MSDAREVSDFSGVRIGTVGPDGAVLDQGGVRIGTATADGAVLDLSGVRMGTVSAGAPQSARPRAA